ncbi:BA75_03356T0 [Komagataella pastoris]|uniref:BA75_03356T0 n=1 Tax=Komagataella pastoris TaxID=4922 RepID=A0A1B2JEB5_PICPA|nr:BA75_03356T0 [Komagataella pastoris]
MFKKYNDNPFNNDKARIGDQLNTLIIEKYLQYCSTTNSDELLESHLIPFLRDKLGIPPKLLSNVENRREKLVYHNTSVLDLKKLFWYASLLLVLKENLSYIDQAWELLTDSLTSDQVSLDELVKLQHKINDSSTYQTMNDMMLLATNGERISMNYVDFAMLLGKLGEIG